jgi:hypothetical protein
LPAYQLIIARRRSNVARDQTATSLDSKTLWGAPAKDGPRERAQD